MDLLKKTVPGILGIDAGGTFTDLAFLDGEHDTVLAKAKTATIHGDLVSTIKNGLDMILEQIDSSCIRSFNLATTLATNAIVEHRLHPAALVLIGYEKELLEKAALDQAFDTPYVIAISGGHDNRGDELAPLDEGALKKEIGKLPQSIKGIAVSGFFSIRNTAHELRATEIIKEIRPDVFLSYGHDLSTGLNAIKRATTTLLNAGLIPIVMELLSSVEKVCAERQIHVPITVVRGDGTVVGSEWAKLHPVEMILSGPAASACGGCFLAKARKENRSSWVVDIGGTTTDIIRLDPEGMPVLLDEGAAVAGHKTLVRAIDIHTFGLGGDSRVVVQRDYSLTLSNRRVRPLCSLASQYPAVLQELRELKKMNITGEPLFLSMGDGEPADEIEMLILRKLKSGPLSKSSLLKRVRLLKKHEKRLDLMEEKGLIQYAAFTPTDALHVLGKLDKWEPQASILGAELLADGMRDHLAQEVAVQVCDFAVKTIAAALFKKSFSASGTALEDGQEGEQMIKYALNHDINYVNNTGNTRKTDDCRIALGLNAMLVGAGAPSWAFIPEIGHLLQEKALLPENTDVAGAVGAAVGSFSMTYPVRIMISKDHLSFRLHYPLGTADFDDIEKAVDFACEFMEPWLFKRAREAGAKDPKVTCVRDDSPAYIGGYENQIPLWTTLSFMASNGN